ncbi:MAG: outer membrane beta-barrel protein, partial [Ramlibacter sp.]|nr:outer membrane beta-barrel protein [Ramlibacter sp.]
MTRPQQLPAGGKLTLATLALLACAPAFAAEPDGWYLGANVGSTREHFAAPAAITPFVGPGFGVSSFTSDDKDKGGKIYGGFRLNRNLAIEGGYFDLGRFDYQYNTVPAGTLSGSSHPRGVNLDVVGIVPLGDRFSVFGRVGGAYVESNTSYNRSGAVGAVTPGDDGFNLRLKYGVGAQYAFSERLSVRAELERYRVTVPIRHRSRVDMASVGLVYYFGDIPRPVMAAPAPAYVAPAPVYVAPP